MTQLLHWAVNNSNATQLAELMQKYKNNDLTLKDMYGQELLDAVFQESTEMRDAIAILADFRNASLPDEELEEAVELLRDLCEQVDNAGNMHRNGGLRPLLELGALDDAAGRGLAIRSSALWSLGVAVQNNAPVQAELLGIGGLEALVGLLPKCARSDGGGAGFCAKLIFALSGLVRNDAAIQAAADGLGLFGWLLDAGVVHPEVAVAKKAMGLVETVLAQSPELPFLDTLAARRSALEAALLPRVAGAGTDVDVGEKVLGLVRRLAELRPFLFSATFRAELSAAAATAVSACAGLNGDGDDGCGSLAERAREADLALTARELGDEEL